MIFFGDYSSVMSKDIISEVAEDKLGILRILTRYNASESSFLKN